MKKNKEKKNKKDKEDRQSVRHIISNMLFVLRYSFKAAPVMTVHKLLGLTGNRILVFFEHTWLLGYIIDSVELGRPFNKVALVIGILFAGSLLYSGIINQIMMQYVYPKEQKNLEKMMNGDIYKKAAEIDLACYDDPSFYDDFIWASSTAVPKTYEILETINNCIGTIVGAAISGIYFAGNDPLGLVIVAVMVAASFISGRLGYKIRFKRTERLKPLERKYLYYNRLFYLSDNAKEMRLNNVAGLILKDHHKTSGKIGEERRRDSGKEAAISIVSSGFFQRTLPYIYLTFLLFRAIVSKTLRYGQVVVLYNALGYMKGNLNWLGYVIPEFEDHSRYVDKVRRFLECEITVKDPDEPKTLAEGGGDIEIKNLSFAYGEKTVLKDIDLTIHKGEKIALVGYNGAGKTTLVKLIMRLYDPTAGEIRYAGENIRDYRLKEYRSSFETVFQDFQIFAGTVGENINLSTDTLDENRAENAAELSGFAEKLGEFEKGYDTEMTREFSDDGIILSGGEEQKLAITRALYRDADVIILDEPSSALDPIAEYNLNHTMLTTQKDKTVITISHRLSTTKMADKIYMLEDGRIIESGTHDELMNLNGKYAEMFNLQAEKYKGE